MGFSRSLFAPLTLLICVPAFSQSVISVHSGVVHFSEGSVFIDDKPVDQKLGTFAIMKEGSMLRTEQGRAEVLLTPGVFLRVDENSSVRMCSAAITDTRVELLQGSVIVDTLDAPADSPVLVTYKDSKARFPKQGIYRFDSEPAPLLQVYSGQAEVVYDGKTSSIDTSHLFFFAAGTETKKFDEGTDDQFYAWARDRSEAIAFENQLAAQTAKDPADVDNGQAFPVDPGLSLGEPTYAPLGGIYSLSGVYSNPYVPFGMGLWSAYPVLYPVYLPRYYYRNTAHSRWPGGVNNTRWSSAAGIGISHYQPSILVPRTFSPGIGQVRSASPRPAVAPARAVSIGAHPIGRR